jgi:pimeloyl-ACP methyl ester carboxylesterase
MTLSQLLVPGFRDAVVSHPLEARSPQAVIVALHGNYDRPEWQCEVWRKVAGKKPFILCPRGEPRSDATTDPDRWTWGEYATVEREVDAAVAALRARFVTFVDGGPIVLVGFSLGATMAARLATRSDGRYSRLVVIEGGEEGWTVRNVRAFDEHGGDRVLAACGQTPCLAKFKTVARAFERAKFPFRLADGGRAGHVYDGPVADAVLREWAWLVEGDPRLTP